MSSFRTAFTVKRKAAGTLVKGKLVEGSTSTITIQASVQPMRGKDVDLLPEGRRTSQAVWIYTDTQLQLSNSTAFTNPDILVAFGSDFEVLSVEPWQSGVISHYKCMAVKK